MVGEESWRGRSVWVKFHLFYWLLHFISVSTYCLSVGILIYNEGGWLILDPPNSDYLRFLSFNPSHQCVYHATIYLSNGATHPPRMVPSLIEAQGGEALGHVCPESGRAWIPSHVSHCCSVPLLPSSWQMQASTARRFHPSRVNKRSRLET